MNQCVYAYRVWCVEYDGFTERFTLNYAVTKEELVRRFKIPLHAKITPQLDNRMRNGGRKLI